MEGVLIAEDHPGLAAMLVKGLGRHGLDATVVDTADRAIDAARHGGYAVLILDLNFTDTGTTTVLRSLREHGCVVPVLVVNGRDGPRDRAAALRAGAADYLCMPFRFTDLVPRLHDLIATATGRRPAAAGDSGAG